MNHVRRLLYTNTLREEAFLVIEPWANQIVVNRGEEIEVIIEGGDPDAVLEIQQTDRGITIFGYAGCVIYARKDGEDLV